VQVDDALAEARLLGNSRNRRIGEPAVGDRADRGQDQLLAALFGRRGAPARNCGELPFGVQWNPIKINKLWNQAPTSVHHLSGFSGRFNE